MARLNASLNSLGSLNSGAAPKLSPEELEQVRHFGFDVPEHRRRRQVSLFVTIVVTMVVGLIALCVVVVLSHPVVAK
jgi:hypothetical protein